MAIGSMCASDVCAREAQIPAKIAFARSELPASIWDMGSQLDVWMSWRCREHIAIVQSISKGVESAPKPHDPFRYAGAHELSGSLPRGTSADTSRWGRLAYALPLTPGMSRAPALQDHVAPSGSRGNQLPNTPPSLSMQIRRDTPRALFTSRKETF
jgi:hypothetical protein